MPSLVTTARDLIYISLALLLAQGSYANDTSEEPKLILVLHSYHQHYPWTHSQESGFVSSLERDFGANFVIVSEHIDTKRAPYNSTYAELLKAYLSQKYHSYKPDLVYATDDNALSLATAYLPNHFQDVPIVFSGVNNLELQETLDKNRYTGVFERKEVRRNIEMLQMLSPEIQSIAVVGDNSGTHIAIKSDLQKQLKSIPSIQATFIEDTNLNVVVSELAKLNTEYVLMTTIGGFQQINGHSVPLEKVIQSLLGSAENRKLISMKDSYLLSGVVGGYVTSGIQQGEAAGRLAAAFLSGTKMRELEMVTSGTNRFMFDHNTLAEANLTLPPSIADQAIVINQPISWVQRNERIIYTSLAALILLTLSLLTILVSTVHRKNRLITKSNELIAVNETLEIKRLQKLERFQDALVHLSRKNFEDATSAFEHACTISAETLCVDRVGIWMTSQDRNQIISEAQYITNQGIVDAGATLARASFPIYFEALDSGRLLAINDVFDSPITSEMVDSYLAPNNIVSMLDVPIVYQGDCIGVVCHEHIGQSRQWSTDEQEFAYTIAKTISLFLEIFKRKEIEQKLEHQAYHDPLTNLPNRELLTDRLDQAILHAERHNEKCAVLFIDLDNFKHINDSLGHTAGDQVIVKVSDLLSSAVRASDTISRFGGDEFIIVMTSFKNTDQIVDAVTSIYQSLQANLTLDGHDLFVSASIGVSVYPDDGITTETLIRNADAAMYHSKQEGRNSFHFYTEEMTQRARERVDIATNLRKAIANKEFVAYFQPQYDIQKNKLIGFEALARWINADNEILTPDKFIPAAEETGLISEIDRLIMNDAMQTYTRWIEQGWEVGTLSLNLSMQQLNNDSFYGNVCEIINIYNFQTNQLNFEITESCIMENPNKAIALLEKFAQLGIGISIDDFGTGYSSLEYLKRLPVDELKIDKSFVLDLLTDENDATIVKTIISLANNLNLKVIAEGVEEQSQADYLLQLGCEKMQGYYYGRPINAETLDATMSNIVNKISI